jgi:hypothetical protein
MIDFKQDFTTDFDAIAAALHLGYAGPPIALSRFGDGEYAILQNMVHNAKSDGWEWGGQENHEFQDLLRHSLIAGSWLDDYYVGISAANHHPRAHAWYMGQLLGDNVPLSKITFASLFIFSNYDRFLPLIDSMDRFITVGGSDRCDYQTPRSPSDPAWKNSASEIVCELQKIDLVDAILVSAGPWASILIHRYWQMTESDRRNTIIDVGSAMDEKMRGRRSRQYHNPYSVHRSWVPRFNGNA